MLAESLLPLLLQFLWGAETTVSFALLEQLVRMLAIDPQTLALAVGRIRAANLRPFLPVQTQPAQIFYQLRFVAGLAALHVGVFNTEYKVSSIVAGEEPVVESRAGVTHVQHTGG